jgi:hypothetical protein
MQHIHLPKVPHGWREFFKEYAIIVLGVLTALALEQAVESIHERRLAREAREAIEQEMRIDVDRVAYRRSQQACNDKRLAEVETLLAEWNDDDAFPAGLHIGFPGDAGLVDQRWQANLANGRFSEQSPEEQTDQAGLYTLIHVLDRVQNNEVEHWAQLRTLEFGSRAISLESKPMIAEALARARGEGQAIAQLSAALLASVRGKLEPSGEFRPASPGTTCQPMRSPADSEAIHDSARDTARAPA